MHHTASQERKELYLDIAKQLIAKGCAYPCFCSPQHLESVRQKQIKEKQNTRYNGACRN